MQQAWAPLAEGKFEIFSNPILTQIAQKHSKSVAQVVLRWLNQCGVAIIPKSVKLERMIENREIFDFTLDAQDLSQISCSWSCKENCYKQSQFYCQLLLFTQRNRRK